MFVSISLSLFCILLAIISYFPKKLKKLQCKSRSAKKKIQQFKHLSFPLPIIDGIYFLYMLKKDGVDHVNKIFEKYESDTILELSLAHLSVLASRDAVYTNKILSSTDPGHLNRPRFVYTRIFVDVLSKGLVVSDYPQWSQQRKVLSKAFTYKYFPEFVETMNKHGIKLASQLTSLCKENGGSISGRKMFDCLNVNTLNIMMDFIFGVQADHKPTCELYKYLWRYKEIIINRFLNPALQLPFVWWFHPHRKELERLSKNIYELIETIIEVQQFMEKMESNLKTGTAQSTCLVETMLRQGASEEEIQSEIGTFLLAGHETVSAALNFILLHIANHSKYQTQCREEIDALINSKRAENSTQDEIYFTIDDLSKLESLERVILESLRIAPVGPFFMRVLNTPLKIDEDLTLEKGRIVMVSPWLVHHNPKYYPDPKKYDPDRFLPKEAAKRGPGTYFPFAGGPRNCIGRKFGMLEMKTTLAWLLHYFEVYSEDGIHDVKLNFEATVMPERDFRITLKARDNTIL